MKRLSLYLFLILFTLQTPSWADDIRDFQIEGMNIGKSILDYYNEKEIKKNIRSPAKDKTFSYVETENIKSEIYNAIQLHYKTTFFYKQELLKSSELIMNCDVSATRFYCIIYL